MILIMIENRVLMSKVVSYFDSVNVKYTTNPNSKYEYFLVAELNQRIIKKIKENILQNKKIIFITYLEEYKINIFNDSQSSKSITYNNLLKNILDECYLVVVSLPWFKDLLNKFIKTKIVVIEKENPKLFNSINFKTLKNNCLIIDYNFKELEQTNDIAIKFPKTNFQILGYVPDYLLSLKSINIIHNFPPNIKIIKSCDFFDYLKLITQNNFIVYCENNINHYNNLIYIILLKKQLLIKNSNIYNKHFINSKNMYLYNDDKDFVNKLTKILENKISNISTDAYILLKDNNFLEISNKFKEILK
ncbi:MAG: hypothetical protein PHW32_02090 [Bacilli bacterium]|nr:hypothetical protein [Bacilli bacterium]MDD4282307.1 hypothetical protein [Bacilli bacterium]MDD4718760.1 hypothetical protein [Bacilli bacterium]